MPSPTRTLRGSPPRRALHERSDSQVNERSLRMIGDPQAPVYGDPFPTKPSQILLPKGYHTPGSASGAEPGVSYGRNQQDETEQDIQGSPKLSTFSTYEDNTGIHQFDTVSSRRPSSTDTSFFTPATKRRVECQTKLYSFLACLSPRGPREFIAHIHLTFWNARLSKPRTRSPHSLLLIPRAP